MNNGLSVMIFLLALLWSCNLSVHGSEQVVEPVSHRSVFQRVMAKLHRKQKPGDDTAPSKVSDGLSKTLDQSAILPKDNGAHVQSSLMPVASTEDKPPGTTDVKTAQAVSTIPGVNVDPSLMNKPVLDPPIKGFHPVKKLLQPVENLEKTSLALGQQIMRLEGPIASLQTPMMGLQTKMTGVENRMGEMQGKLSHVQGSMVGVTKDMHDIGHQMHGVRGDLVTMRHQIVELEKPITGLREPITAVAHPVEGVQSQLATVQKELADLKALLSTIIFVIFIAACAIALGTPVAAVMIYKHRHKLLPAVKEKDFPVVSNK